MHHVSAPNVSIHRIKRIRFSEIAHYPPDDRTVEFWTRTMIVETDAEEFCLPLFSNSAGGLALPIEQASAVKLIDLLAAPVDLDAPATVRIAGPGASELAPAVNAGA